MKKILIIIIFIGILWNFTFGIEQYKGDCGLAKIEIDKILDGLDFSNNLVIKKEEVKLANDNLKKYCCSKGILDCEDTADEVPQSFYIFEQLLDIGLRKLDGDDKRKIYRNLQLDTDGQEYRQKLKEIAYDKEKKDSKEILEIYNDYFDFKSTDKLYYKYNKLCKEIDDVNNNLFKVNTDQKNNSLGGGFMVKCQQVVANRLNTESNYVTSLVVKKSNEQMLDNLKNYTDEYFIKTKFDALVEKFTQVLGIFRLIVRRANPGVGICDGG